MALESAQLQLFDKDICSGAISRLEEKGANDDVLGEVLRLQANRQPIGEGKSLVHRAGPVLDRTGKKPLVMTLLNVHVMSEASRAWRWLLKGPLARDNNDLHLPLVHRCSLH